MIIFLYGVDSYRIQQKLNKYKQKFLRDIDASGINIEILEGAEITVESFRKAVLSGGLFIKKRMVIIKNIFSNRKDKSIFTEIENCVKRNEGDADNILIFIQNQEHKSHLSKLFKILLTQKFSEEFKPLTGSKLNQWIKKEAEARGGKITREAVQALVVSVGNNLWQMSNEIDKLLGYKEGKAVEVDDVRLLVRARADENIFNLTDAFSRKDKAGALKLFADQINAGISFQYLLTMIARQIKILLQIKDALANNRPQYGLAKELGLHPYAVQKSIPQARNFTFDELKKIYSQLLGIDVKLKTSSIEPEALFDLLVAQMDVGY
ncbi:DNA polymerase III subunit delta [Candidatus Parcubacteria bacterium]|nr:DNA polymerase III subunit delta [Patescibacteria group bacterium]MCG2692657.1 DNA polymerase III subunit delta [Candidatus Parcubacteria bacterium]